MEHSLKRLVGLAAVFLTAIGVAVCSAVPMVQALELDTHVCTGPNDCGPSRSCLPRAYACAHGGPNGDCDFGEECDDGNTINGDGCDNNCTLTGCDNGILTAGEECDNGAANDCVQPTLGGNPCDTSCRLKACGNGRVECDEQCDDGDTFNLDDCDSGAPGPKGSCLLPACGNGITDSPPEACDDGNTINGDGCDNNCTFPACGNGIVDPGEVCDDGNTLDGDFCNSTCTVAVFTQTPTMTPTRTPTPSPPVGTATRTSTPSPTPTLQPSRARLLLTGQRLAKPQRSIKFVARYKKLVGPNTLAAVLPPGVSVSKVKPLPLSNSGGQLTWNNLRRPGGTVSITVGVDPQVPAGTAISATATLTDGFGGVAGASAAVVVGPP